MPRGKGKANALLALRTAVNAYVPSTPTPSVTSTPTALTSRFTGNGPTATYTATGKGNYAGINGPTPTPYYGKGLVRKPKYVGPTGTPSTPKAYVTPLATALAGTGRGTAYSGVRNAYPSVPSTANPISPVKYVTGSATALTTAYGPNLSLTPVSKGLYATYVKVGAYS